MPSPSTVSSSSVPCWWEPASCWVLSLPASASPSWWSFSPSACWRGKMDPVASSSPTTRSPIWWATWRWPSYCSTAACAPGSRPFGWHSGPPCRLPPWASPSPRAWRAWPPPGCLTSICCKGCWSAPSSVPPMRRQSSPCLAGAASTSGSARPWR